MKRAILVLMIVVFALVTVVPTFAAPQDFHGITVLPAFAAPATAEAMMTASLIQKFEGSDIKGE